MPQIGIFALAAGASLFVLLSPLRRSFVVLLGVVMLVPDTLVVPNGITPYPTVLRVALYSFVIRLFLAHRRGELREGAFRWTRTHIAFAAFTVVAFVNGIALAAPTTPSGRSLFQWLAVIDQFLFFAAVLAFLRADGKPRWAAGVLSVFLLASVAIAIGEHFIHRSWSAWFFANVPGANVSDPARPLEVRGGQVRIRAAAEFSLAFSWVTTMLLPVLAAVVTRARRLAAVAPFLVAGAMAAVVWSYTRSALPAAAASLVILWLAARFDARIGLLVAGGLAVAALLFFAAPDALRPLSAPETEGSVEVRTERLPVILGIVSERPFLGFGLGGLDEFGLPTTDTSYLLMYAELGVIGFAIFLALLLTAMVESVGALRGPRGPAQVLAAGGFTALLLVPIGAAAYDFFSLPGSALPFWLIVALLIALAEARRGRSVSPMPGRLYVRTPVLVGVGLLIGVVVLVATPRRASAVMQFQTIPVGREARVLFDPSHHGSFLANTACGLTEHIAVSLPSSDVSCRRLLPAAGVGRIRIEGPDESGVGDAAQELSDKVGRFLPGFRTFAISKPRADRPTWTRTAPAWLAVAGAAGVLLLPRGARGGRSARGRAGGRSESEPGSAPRMRGFSRRPAGTPRRAREPR